MCDITRKDKDNRLPSPLWRIAGRPDHTPDLDRKGKKRVAFFPPLFVVVADSLVASFSLSIGNGRKRKEMATMLIDRESSDLLHGGDDDNPTYRRLALLVSCIDRRRLCADNTLLGMCFRRLVSPERLCAAFARSDRGAPWTDQSSLGEVLRAHLNFGDACNVLQKTAARALSGGPAPLSFVACCGCTRPWCTERPCATGWMLPITERARNRLAAWQWAETIRPDAPPSETAFGGFFARELVQCTTADLGYRLMPCSRRRQRAPGADVVQSQVNEQPLPKRSRGNPDDADDTGDLDNRETYDHHQNSHEPADLQYKLGDDDGTQQEPHNTVGGREPDTPMVMSCGPRGVIAIRDGGMYVAAVATSRRHDLAERVHPSIPVIRARDSQRDGGCARRWVRVTGDAYIVRVYAPASIEDAMPWDAQG